MITGSLALLTMLVAAIQDFMRKEISIWIIVFGGLLSLVSCCFYIIGGNGRPAEVLLAVIPGVVVLVLAFVSREGIGYGDGLLIFALGPVFGLRSIMFGLVIAFFLSGIVSGILLVVKRAGKKFTIPFVPFLAFGMGVCLFAQI